MSGSARPIAIVSAFGALALIGWLALSSGMFGTGPGGPDREPVSPSRSAAADHGVDANAPTAPPTNDLERPEHDDATSRSARGAATAALPDFGDDGDAPAGASAPCEVDGADTNGGASAESSVRIAGAIRGVLVREGGAWTEETLPRGKTVMLDLVELREPHESRRGVLEAKRDASGGYELSFAFEELPEGEYELTLSALGSWRWTPVALRVRPPSSGIVFTRYDEDKKLPLAFEVTDARSGAKLTSFQTRHVQLTPSEDAGIFLQTGPLDVDAFPIDARFTWTLWADGYAAAFGDETAFLRRGDRRVADVRLEPGWSTRVLVLAKDPLARQVRGAEVLVDGHGAGFTDAAGMLIVRAPARPTSLTVRHAGWSMQNDPLAPYKGMSAEQRAHTTLVFLTR